MKSLKTLVLLLLVLAKASLAQITATNIITTATCANIACFDSYAAKIKYKPLFPSSADSTMSYGATKENEVGRGNSIVAEIYPDSNLVFLNTFDELKFTTLKSEFETLGFVSEKPYDGKTGFFTYKCASLPKYKIQIYSNVIVSEIRYTILLIYITK